jgi:hypothetical protein
MSVDILQRSQNRGFANAGDQVGAPRGDLRPAPGASLIPVAVMSVPSPLAQSLGAFDVIIKTSMAAVPAAFNAGTGYATLLSYNLLPGQTLTLARAWVEFSAPAVADIASAIIFAGGAATQFYPLVQDEIDYQDRLVYVVTTPGLVELKIARTGGSGWSSYGRVAAGLLGWAQ